MDDTPDPADFMATPHLFRHKYDIDTIISALCTGQPGTLNTGAGTYPLESLPQTYLAESFSHPSFTKLPATTQQAVQTLVQTCPLANLPNHFGTPHGDWLRERIKDAALEWLDSHNLIPPSMRHVPRHIRSLNAPVKKVTIA
ncbi:MAG: hypothetical protein H6922_02040 [Pseudomonadaceae bacterium]|nr:hypothetical protein [Pseudomonadaceae bacterium]